MPLVIGLKNNPTQLVLDANYTLTELESLLEGSEKHTLSLTDKDGISYLIPLSSVAYIRVGEPAQKQVGFRI